MTLRVGIGYDVHPLVAGRELILGGVKVPFELGLDGHSDADVLTHAIIDAILGAARLGDIGRLFPDSDPAYRGADSLELLKRVGLRLREAGMTVVNIDAVVVAQRPRIAPFVDRMGERISEALGLSPADVGIKGKTTEGLGFEGRGEGISAHAVALIERCQINSR